MYELSRTQQVFINLLQLHVSTLGDIIRFSINVAAEKIMYNVR